MPMTVTTILLLMFQENYKMSSTIQTWRLRLKVLQNCVKIKMLENLQGQMESALNVLFSNAKMHVLLSLLFSMCLPMVICLLRLLKPRLFL